MRSSRGGCSRRVQEPCEGREDPARDELCCLRPTSGLRWTLRTGQRAQDSLCKSCAPIKIASASWHALSVDAGRGSPVESIAHPPNSCDSSLSSMSCDAAEITSRTRTASATTSGPSNTSEIQSQTNPYQSAPIPSPGRTTTRKLSSAILLSDPQCAIEVIISTHDFFAIFYNSRWVQMVLEKLLVDFIGLARVPLGGSVGRPKRCEFVLCARHAS